MKRLHVHISVPDLDQAIEFYSLMLGTGPTRVKQDYAKWQLDDPQVNFAISTRSGTVGLDHLGMQVNGEEELNQLNASLLSAGTDTGQLDSTTCCYANSVKSWSIDPAGIPWESFVTMNDVDVYGETNQKGWGNSACCAGAAPTLDEPERPFAQPIGQRQPEAWGYPQGDTRAVRQQWPPSHSFRGATVHRPSFESSRGWTISSWSTRRRWAAPAAPTR